MTLRRKLLIAFGGLAILALLAAAVTVYITVRWQGTTEEVQRHYQRSLLLQSVRAQTFQALAEVNDALAGEPDDYADARGDFERAIATTDENFAQWRTLSEDVAETVEILEVQSSYQNLLTYARQVFALLDAGRLAEAVRLVDDELDTGDYARFQEATERAVAADERNRQSIVALSQDLRGTALVMSAVTMIAALSLTLLIAAYLAQDLFHPLAELRRLLTGLAEGDTSQRMAVNRADEFGRVAVAFNRAAEAQESRSGKPVADSGQGEGGRGGSSPRRILLEAVGRLKADLSGLHGARLGEGEGEPIFQRMRGEIQGLEDALELGFPAIGTPVLLDPRRTAQEALAAIGPLLAERGVSCECELEPRESAITADRVQLREILNGALHDALAVLPEHGGRIGLRIRSAPDTGHLHIDVATTGGRPIAEAPDMPAQDEGPDSTPRRMRRQIVMELGGKIEIAKGSGGSEVARLTFPLSR